MRNGNPSAEDIIAEAEAKLGQNARKWPGWGYNEDGRRYVP
jgi:hypothetical protein